MLPGASQAGEEAKCDLLRLSQSDGLIPPRLTGEFLKDFAAKCEPRKVSVVPNKFGEDDSLRLLHKYAGWLGFS